MIQPSCFLFLIFSKHNAPVFRLPFDFVGAFSPVISPAFLQFAFTSFLCFAFASSPLQNPLVFYFDSTSIRQHRRFLSVLRCMVHLILLRG